MIGSVMTRFPVALTGRRCASGGCAALASPVDFTRVDTHSAWNAW
jgi:hypothetical protein